MDFGKKTPDLETYQVGAYFEALDEGVLLVPLDPRYTQVGFNLVSVQVCLPDGNILLQNLRRVPIPKSFSYVLSLLKIPKGPFFWRAAIRGNFCDSFQTRLTV